MSKTSYRSIIRLMETSAKHGVPQLLGSTLAFIALGVGVSMFVAPFAYLDAHILKIVFRFASPYAWGTAYIVTATAILFAVYSHPRHAQVPLYMLAAIFATHGLLTIPQIANGGVPQSLFFLIGLAWICVITQMICGVAVKEKQNAASQTSVDHKPR